MISPTKQTHKQRLPRNWVVEWWDSSPSRPHLWLPPAGAGSGVVRKPTVEKIPRDQAVRLTTWSASDMKSYTQMLNVWHTYLHLGIFLGHVDKYIPYIRVVWDIPRWFKPWPLYFSKPWRSRFQQPWVVLKDSHHTSPELEPTHRRYLCYTSVVADTKKPPGWWCCLEDDPKTDGYVEP